MNLSLKWLSEYVDIDVTAKEYCDRMTDTGSKVEGFEMLSENIENVMVGKVLSLEKHPDADRLTVCKVDVGEAEPIQIVTAATNLVVDALVPVARHKSTLADGTKITKGKLRGVVSEGMFCSFHELGLTQNDVPYGADDGILILKEPCKIGDDIRDALDMRDTVVEFEITPNRPDCLCVIGLAKESAVSFDKPIRLHTPEVKGCGDGDKIENYLDVEIKNPELCFRYTARAVKNVKIEPSPLWLRARLRASGVRPINNIVDITNYVMLEYGQPMHAFDYSCLEGKKINVRLAEKDEPMQTLDDKEYKLSENMLVIADENKPVALAGVMGGANSDIKDTTKTVIFESACFDGPCVRTTSRALGIRTESSGRFEKGLDRENTYAALERACELVEMLGAGEVVNGIIDVYPAKKEQTVIPFDSAKINELLGTGLSEEYMEKVLTALEFKIKDGKVYVPSYREDVERCADIAEEVARIYGYNNIVSTPIAGASTTGGLTQKQKYIRDLNAMLTGMGLSEIYTYSFISPKSYDKLRLPEDSSYRKCVTIKNPLGEDTSVMRTTALSGMMEVLARNYNFRNKSARFYEIAKVYIPKEDINELPDEKVKVTLGIYGDCDFYTLAGIINKLLKLSGIEDAKITACKDNVTFHSGRCANMYIGDELLATLGQAHPETVKNFGAEGEMYIAQIDFDTLFAHCNFKREYTPLPKFPAATRDFAFICKKSLESARLCEAIKSAAGKFAESVKLFDLYESEALGDNKSLAYSLTLRAPDRTLTDDEAEEISKKVIAAAESLGATLRR